MNAADACAALDHQRNPFVLMPEGQFISAASPVYPEEGPSLRVRVEPFLIQTHEVTNDAFAAFVAATGYITDAERVRDKSSAPAGSGYFSAPQPNQPGVWGLSASATWRTPDGEGSTLEGKGRYPVVHVSLRDARAYAAWMGARLPTEVEWEYAAAIGLRDPQDPRSGAYDANGAPIANTWQGVFPIIDERSDGFGAAAPVGCFAQSRVGLFDMIGNVWEWTDTPSDGSAQFIIKGGSFLCANNFCGRFRPGARQAQDADFSTNHIGFRLVKDVQQR